MVITSHLLRLIILERSSLKAQGEINDSEGKSCYPPMQSPEIEKTFAQ